jgi:hypothetical protein
MRMPCLSGPAAVLCLHMLSHVCLAVRCNGAALTLHGWQDLPQPCCPQWRWVFIHVENGLNQKVPDELFQFGEHLVPL